MFNFSRNWYNELLNDSEFMENLKKLGDFEYFDDELDEPIIFSYWTDTRWKIFEKNKKKYILSPAFWKDENLEVRFALFGRFTSKLFIYVKKPNFEDIIGNIGCFKIITEYNPDLKEISKKTIKLSPKDELMGSIQNLDHFFTEKTPYFMSFDYNIVYRALKIIIDKGLASNKLLENRCYEIKKILFKLIKDDADYNKINPQIYIQIKALLDFDPESWFPDIYQKFNILKYFERIIEIEEIDLKYGVLNIIIHYFDKFPKEKELILLKFVKLDNVAGHIARLIAQYYDKLPDNMKSLIYEIAKNKSVAKDVAWSIIKNIKNLPDKYRNLLLQMSENSKTVEAVALAVGENWNKIPEPLRNQLFLKFSENESAAIHIEWRAISNIFQSFPKNVVNKILYNLLSKKGAQGDLVVIILYHFEELPEGLRISIYNLLEERDIVYDEIYAIVDNYEKLPINFKGFILNKLLNNSEALNYLINEIGYKIEDIPYDIRKIL
ncbi:MAG: hypothetical protein HWN67_14300 [Candidatus Helarchaeota archaeon]|nr:hypothetical protein [Candidatus Helarchaeota archaeon]